MALLAIALQPLGCAALWGFEPLGTSGAGAPDAEVAPETTPADAQIDSPPATTDAADANAAGCGPCDNELLLFGGEGIADTLSDTWTFDGAWHVQTPTQFPSPRPNSADPIAPWNGGVLYLGLGLDTKNETWLWDRTDWSLARPAKSPIPRMAAAMAPLPSGRVLLFGGWGVPATTNDTWIWDGLTWTPISPAHVPPGRSYASAAAFRGEVLLFGGFSPDNQPLNDLWTFEESTLDWTYIEVPSGPSGRAEVAFAARSGALVAFGGHDSFKTLGETWEWDGATWKQITPKGTAPTARFSASAARFRGDVVLFGGTDTQGHPLSDTWRWDGVSWSAIPGDGPSSRARGALCAYR